MVVNGTWFDDLDAVAADAAGRLDRADQPCLYDRLDWFRLTATHILPHARPAVARVSRAGSSAWLFLHETRPRCAAPFAGWYTLRFGPVLFGADADNLLPDLYRIVAERFDILEMFPVLDLPPPIPGWRHYSHRYSTNWTITLKGQDFETYWAARPSPVRRTTTRKARSRPVAITIHKSFDHAAWDDYEAIYAESWKPAEGSLPFLRDLAALEAAAGTLRLGIAYDPSGTAVAAQFWLVEQGVATIHKLAHRESAKAGSPGTLLSHAMFRAAIDDDRVSRIDFGLGDEPYKADWMDTPSPVWRIDAYRPFTPAGALGVGREIAARLVRPRARG